jgi:predicted phage terminase large subunit-like protein
MQPVKLTSDLIESFAATYLSAGYDDAKPTPDFHREGWALYSSDELRAGIAAPRGHAKSTSFTHDFTLATALFRAEDYIIVISTNEELAIEHLGDITRELIENEELIEDFQIKGFVTNSKTEIIVEMQDGHQFRILARGSGQKMRGRKWRGKRPGLIVCDDLEDDEQVENKERRDKFRRWFFRAVIPALRRGGKIRIHGTILHEDSLLARLMLAPTWQTLFYKAHAAFDDFSNILWPEQYDEKTLRAVRQSYIEQFDSSGYSQEYLNDPFDNSEAYLRKADFHEMEGEDFVRPMRLGVGIDFAISKKDKANRTSMTVAGQTAENVLQFIDQHVGRWDTPEIIDKMFEIQELHDPMAFFVEDGVIWKAVEPILNRDMAQRGVFLNCIPLSAMKDKATKGRSWQKRMKAGACKFDKEGDWYANFEHECLRFTGYSESTLDDQFDSAALCSRGFDSLPLQEEEDFMDEDELYERGHGANRGSNNGRSTTTGY